MSRPAIAALTGLRFWLHIMLPAYKWMVCCYAKKSTADLSPASA